MTTDTLPELPTPKYSETIRGVPCITVTEHEHLMREYALRARAILALHPVQVPMTDDQVWHNDALMSANGIAGFKMDALMRIVRAVEAHHFGITAQAKKEDA